MNDLQRRRVELLVQFFFNRTDKVAVITPKGTPSPGLLESSLEALVASHVCGSQADPVTVGVHLGSLRGPHRIGSYSPAPDGTTRWLCLDFDGGPDHSSPLREPWREVVAAYQILQGWGIQAYIERSGGGSGYHLWVFFDSPVEAALARRLGDACWPRTALLVSGKSANPKLALGIEIFPKSSKVGSAGCGMPVWLPFWHGASPGGAEFYRMGATEPEPYEPDTFLCVSRDVVERALTEAGANAGVAPRTGGVSNEARSRSGRGKDEQRKWRQDALSRLPLESVYGSYLTGGQVSVGWLECRDPDSPSGDKQPSAGVADGNGKAERGSFHSFRTAATESVFDFMVRQGIAPTIEDAMNRVAEFSGVSRPSRAKSDKKPANARRTNEGIRPSILLNNKQLRCLVDEAWDAVLAENRPTPKLFVREGRLVRVDERRRQIELLNDVGMVRVLTDSADWFRMNNKGDQIASKPDTAVARDMLEHVNPGLPVLDGLVLTPVVGRSGEVISAPGYRATDRVWHIVDPGLDVGLIPDRPTDEDVRWARETLLEPIEEFNFDLPSDQTHYLCAMIQPFARLLYSGPSPLVLVDAPVRGSGKTLLTKLIAALVLGRPGIERPYPGEEEELRKAIAAELVAGQQIICWDNVPADRTVSSYSLAGALTSVHWRDRVLGETRTVELLNHALWMMTGNNVLLSDELARRAIRVRLDPGMERPESRQFKREDLVVWVLARRGQLIRAILVLIRAWIRAGSPAAPEKLGSFEGWAVTVGGIVQHAGLQGFLQDRDRLHRDSDASHEWEAMVECWRHAYGDSAVQTRSIVALADQNDLLSRALGDGNEQSRWTRMGQLLRQMRDRVIGGNRIEFEGNSNRAGISLYRLRQVDASGRGDLVGTARGPSARAGPNT